MPPRDDGKLLLPGLDMLFSTGSILHAEERDALMRNVCPWYLNFYGSTDGGGATALFWHDPPEVSGSVGRPVFGAEIDIAGDNDTSLSPGEIGHIRYKHPGTATGYHNDAEASKTAFRNGWYYPGDLGSRRRGTPRRPREGSDHSRRRECIPGGDRTRAEPAARCRRRLAVAGIRRGDRRLCSTGRNTGSRATNCFFDDRGVGKVQSTNWPAG